MILLIGILVVHKTLAVVLVMIGKYTENSDLYPIPRY